MFLKCPVPECLALIIFYQEVQGSNPARGGNKLMACKVLHCTEPFIIPPTYEVCGCSPDIRSMWLYPRHTKYVGVKYLRLTVRQFVRTFVRSFVRLSVTGSVFALKFIGPHFLKTL